MVSVVLPAALDGKVTSENMMSFCDIRCTSRLLPVIYNRSRWTKLNPSQNSSLRKYSLVMR